MSQQLIKYEAACRALAECKSIDEAKTWTDKAAAMQAYGRMAKDKTLEVDAAEIRIRAERRLGEMLAAQKTEGGLSKGAADMDGNQHTGKLVRSSQTTAPKLADAGISKDLSSRAQKLAAVPAAEFEAELAAKRERDRQDGARVSARLQRAGERELQKADRPSTEAHAPAVEMEGPSAADLLDTMERELRQAQGQVSEWEKAMLADDSKGEVAKALRRAEHAERRQRELMEDAAVQKKRADFYERQLARCGKAVGQRDLDKVAAAIESMARSQKVAA